MSFRDNDRPKPWEGSLGWIIAFPMHLFNLSAERRGVQALAPGGDGHVLVVGYGTGGGIRLLIRQFPRLRVTGIDATPKMGLIARFLNGSAIRRGTLSLEIGPVGAAGWDDESFDGLLAVNNIQLWTPRDESLATIFRVLRHGAPLVANSHAFTVAEKDAIDGWLSQMTADLRDAGFVEVSTERRGHGLGEEVWMRAKRP